MRIKYIGASTVRLFGAYEFNKRNDRTCEVTELPQIQEMLTQPGVDLAVAPDDPLALLVGVDRAAELAVLEGITTLEEYRAAHPVKEFREEVGYRHESGED